MSNLCKCGPYHLHRRLQYFTDYHGRVTSLPICGFYITNEVICFCEEVK